VLEQGQQQIMQRVDEVEKQISHEINAISKKFILSLRGLIINRLDQLSEEDEKWARDLLEATHSDINAVKVLKVLEKHGKDIEDLKRFKENVTHAA
ncbi:hypothetical protein HON22_06190, partial [Candidatus Peregrinibacteria bacterium]|nr:hypothetical protein [Candidatus Peregrinibacteria bacterium]